MPTGTAIARAYVQIVPSMRGVGESIVTAFQGHGLKAGKAAGQSATEGMRHGLAGMSAVFGAVSQLASKAMDTIGSSISGAVNRADVMNNFPKIMRNFGYSADDAKKSISSMSDAIDGLPTSLPALASMVQQLTPVTGSLKDATSISIAFNNALLAGGQSTQVQTNALIQYSQMLAAGKPDMMAWRSIEDAMPGQLNQVAKAMLGPTANSKQLYDAIKAGTVGFDDLNREMVRLNTQGSGQYASFAQQARDATQGIGTAVENVGNRIQKAIQGVIDAVGVERIAGTINQFSEGIRDVGNQVAQFAGRLMDTQGMRAFASAIRAIGTAAHGILGAINSVAAGFIGVKTGSGEAASAGSAVGSVLGRLGNAAREAAGHVRAFFHGLDASALRSFGTAARSLLGAVISVGEAFADTVASVLGFDTSTSGARSGADSLSGTLRSLAGALEHLSGWVQQNRYWIASLATTLIAARVSSTLFSAAHGRIAAVLGDVASGAKTAAAKWDSLASALKNTATGSSTARSGIVWLGSAASTAAKSTSDLASALSGSAASAADMSGKMRLTRSVLMSNTSAVGKLASGTKKMGDTTAQAANMVGNAMNAASAGTSTMSTAAGLAGKLGSALSGVSTVLGGVGAVASIATTAYALIRSAQAADTAATKQWADQLTASYKKGSDAVSKFWQSTKSGASGKIGWGTKLATADSSIKDLARDAGVSMGQVRAAVEKGGSAITSLGDHNSKAAKSARELQYSMEASGQGMSVATAQAARSTAVQGALQDAVSKAHNQLIAAQAAANDYARSLTALKGAAGAITSHLGQLGTLFEAYDVDLSKGGDLTGSLASKTKDYVDQLRENVKVQLANGASQDDMMVQMQQARQAFISSAEAAGASADQAANLADKYGLIPKNVVTDLVAHTDAANNDVQAYLKTVKGVPEGKKQLIYSALTKQAGGDIRNLHLNMKQIPKAITSLINAKDLTPASVASAISGLAKVPKDKKARISIIDGVTTPLASVGVKIRALPGNKKVQISGDNRKLIGVLAKTNKLKVDPKTGKLTLTKNQFDAALQQANLARIDPKTGRLLANAAQFNAVKAMADRARLASHTSRLNGDKRDFDSKASAVRGCVIPSKSVKVKADTGDFFSGVQSALSWAGQQIAHVFVHADKKASGGPVIRRAMGGPIRHFASGGFDGRVLGAGTATSDSIPAMLSNGEYVIRAASAQSLGLENLDRMNQTGRLPATIIRDDSADRALLAQLVGLRDDLRHLDGQKIVLDGRELGRAVEKYRI